MLEVPIYNTDGQKTGSLQVDEQSFGGEVNVSLLKQAIVTYHANRRQGTVATKGRGDVAGSTRKLYNQKHTGNARRGNIRTNIMRGGGMAFGKRPRDFRKGFPRGMRRAALDSAILAKLLGNDLLVVDGLKIEAPKTRAVVGLMRNLKIERSCLLTLAERDRNVYLSSRNLPNVTVMTARELNAFDVATRQKMLVTSDAMKALMGREAQQ
ncbi:MAG: 50S ribosomal protein L4 [Phycisphaerae bacterium]